MAAVKPPAAQVIAEKPSHLPEALPKLGAAHRTSCKRPHRLHKPIQAQYRLRQNMFSYEVSWGSNARSNSRLIVPWKRFRSNFVTSLTPKTRLSLLPTASLV